MTKVGAGMMDRRRFGAAIAAAAALVIIPGCSDDGSSVAASDKPGARGGSSSDKKDKKPTPKPTPQAKITVLPAKDAKDVKLDSVVKIGVTGGTLSSVAVTDKAGKEVEGQFDAERTMWTASQILAPEMSYKVKAEAKDSAGLSTKVEQSFRTLKPTKVLGTDITPLDKTTIGVGMPIVVKFTHSIKSSARADIERRLVIETSKPVEGAWHWFTPDEVHYRPKTYWPAHMKVTLKVNTKGATNGDGAWGIRDKVRTFTIDKAVVFKVNLKNYKMNVYIDGKKARTIPVTGGKKGWETRSGTKVVLERRTNIRFRNEAIAAPEEYDLVAPYGLRMTWSGEFLHTADWSIASQGKRNVSHGCVGMNVPNSKWIWQIAHVGDPIEVISTGDRMPVTGNGFGDWNMSWANWKAGSALS